MSDKRVRNIKEGGYQPISDPPSPPNGSVPAQAVNPITGNPSSVAPETPPADSSQIPPASHGNDGD